MRLLLFVLIFCCVSFAEVVVHNGTTTILEIDKKKVQKITKNGKNMAILAHPKDSSKGIVFVPIGYKKKNDINIDFYSQGEQQKLLLKVKPKKYKVENLKVQSSKVKPPKSVLKRISKEYKEAMQIYATRTKERYWSKPFISPMNSAITSHYGNARVFNGQLKSYHGGTDFRAKVGTPVYASNDGVVVMSKDRYYAGGSVVIDHGEGIYTCYYHLSKMPLQVGVKVKQGDLIGYSGKSGRVTGPHLHFTVMVQGKSVDSQDFIPKVNGLFE